MNWRQAQFLSALTMGILLTGCIQNPIPVKGGAAGTAEIRQVRTVTVPDVSGVRESQAREVIEAKGLTIDVHTSHSVETPAGQVISQSPTKGSDAREGATVKVTISTGPETEAPSRQQSANDISPSSVNPPSEPKPVPHTVSPNSSQDELTRLGDAVHGRHLFRDDLRRLSRWQLDILRNWPFARYGYQFRRADLTTFFRQFDWYAPDTGNQERVERRLTPTERYNVELIQQYQKSQGMIP